MNKENIENLPLEDSKSHPGALTKKALIKNKGNLISISEAYMNPGKKVDAHEHKDMEESFYILEGNGIIRVDEEEEILKKGDVIFIPINHPHAIENTGKDVLKFITVGVKV